MITHTYTHKLKRKRYPVLTNASISKQILNTGGKFQVATEMKTHKLSNIFSFTSLIDNLDGGEGGDWSGDTDTPEPIVLLLAHDIISNTSNNNKSNLVPLISSDIYFVIKGRTEYKKTNSTQFLIIGSRLYCKGGFHMSEGYHKPLSSSIYSGMRLSSDWVNDWLSGWIETVPYVGGWDWRE